MTDWRATGVVKAAPNDHHLRAGSADAQSSPASTSSGGVQPPTRSTRRQHGRPRSSVHRSCSAPLVLDRVRPQLHSTATRPPPPSSGPAARTRDHSQRRTRKLSTQRAETTAPDCRRSVLGACPASPPASRSRRVTIDSCIWNAAGVRSPGSSRMRTCSSRFRGPCRARPCERQRASVRRVLPHGRSARACATDARAPRSRRLLNGSIHYRLMLTEHGVAR